MCFNILFCIFPPAAIIYLCALSHWIFLVHNYECSVSKLVLFHMQSIYYNRFFSPFAFGLRWNRGAVVLLLINYSNKTRIYVTIILVKLNTGDRGIVNPLFLKITVHFHLFFLFQFFHSKLNEKKKKS